MHVIYKLKFLLLFNNMEKLYGQKNLLLKPQSQKKYFKWIEVGVIVKKCLKDLIT